MLLLLSFDICFWISFGWPLFTNTF